MLSKARANTSLTLQTGPWSLLMAHARAVRTGVFIEEQGIDPALEWDDDDATALHALVWCDGTAVGTGRLLASQAGVARIGRMAVLAPYRGRGLAAALLESLLQGARERGDHTALLHAQCSAVGFYQRAGFVSRGERFVEAGIEHIEMSRPLRDEHRPDQQESKPMNDTPAFSTCDLCDAHKADTSGAFRVLPPVFRDFGARVRFAGEVVTVQCFEDNSLVKQRLESPGDGRVLVVDGAGSLRRALLGGNIGAAAALNGWAGVVIDGCVRDVRELAACDVGIRALAAMPLPTERRQQGVADLPVRLQGVWVRPGEWLCADEDGIVVMPSRPASPT